MEHTLTTGEQPAGKPHRFTVEAGALECRTAKFSGTTVGTFNDTSWTSEDLSITPEYREWPHHRPQRTARNRRQMNEYTYTFTAGEPTEEGTKADGTTDILCPAGKVIEWEVTAATGCKIIMPPQNGVPGITYHNTGSGTARDVDWITSITPLRYIQDGSFCPNNNFQASKSFTN